MNNFNISILGYNSSYKKFLNHINDKKTKYKLKLIDKSKNVENLNYNRFKNRLIKEKIKIIALCNNVFIGLISKDIDFFIKKKIKIVQASSNFDIDNHGFIIEKPFRDYSFEDLFLRETLNLDVKLSKAILKNKKVIITGGAGSIGCGLVKKLLFLDVKKIHVLDSSEYNIFKLKNSIDLIEHKKKIEFHLTNIENFEFLKIDFKKIKPDIVFHAAALKHVVFLEKNVRQGIYTNIIGTKNTLLAAAKNNTKYFIHISTDKAADPSTVLGYTKLISEYICYDYKKSNIKIGIVRFGNVFNSFGSVAETFRNQIFQVKKIKLSHPDVERYFMSLSEASNLIISTLQIISNSQNKLKCRTFVCDMGKPIKIKNLATKILFLCGRVSSNYISKSYYGLKNIEKLSEKLISENEKIIKIVNKRIFEIKRFYKKINLSKIQNLIRISKSDKILKKQLKKLI